MKKTPFLIVAALLAVSAGPALAQSADKVEAPAARKSLDANNDGVVDRAEAAAHPRLAARFDTLDANKDGRLERGELPRGHGKHGRRGPGSHLVALDTDKDGRISQAEAAAEPKFAARFARLDANGDGFVDRADRQALARQRHDEWFKAADADKDGKLSKAEFDAAHARRAEEAAKRGWGPGRAPAAAPAAK